MITKGLQKNLNQNMTSQEAKELVRKTFKKIKNSKSISEIDEILA